MKRQLLTGALAASTLTFAAFSQANPAHALSFSGGSVSLTSGDIGSSFLVNFDGNVENTNISRLSAQALFRLTGFTANQANFSVDLTNTTTAPVGSRVSGIAFDTDPNINSGTASGIFDSVDISSSLPNGFGNVEVCVAGNSSGNCGGGNSGVTTGNTGNFLLTLGFGNNTNLLTSGLTLSKFGVRYQSVTGVTQGTSGTGRGTPIPTPALLPAVLGMGAAVLRKKKQEAKVAEEV